MTKDFRKYLILTLILEVVHAALICGMIFFAWRHQAVGIAICAMFFPIAYIALNISGKFFEGALLTGTEMEIIDFDNLLEGAPLEVIEKVGENRYKVLKTSAHPYFYPDIKRIVKNIPDEVARVGCKFNIRLFFQKNR